MSTSSLETRNLTRPSGVLNLFALSALPILLMIGLLITLGGCSSPTASLNTEPVATASISQYEVLGTPSADGIQQVVTSGGRLGS